MKSLSLLLVLAGVVVSTGCARQISSNVYSAHSVGEATETYPGVIISSRTVDIEDGEYLGDNTLGIIGGGVGGALLGSTIGKGSGNTLATVAGGLIGATGGAFAEKALKSQQGMEYVVSLENGQSRTVVQGMDPQLAVGQNVFLMVSHQGRSRIVSR